MLDAWLAEIDEFGVDGATVSVGSVARTLEAVVKTTLGEQSDVWLAEVSAFNVNTLEGTLIVVKSDFDGTEKLDGTMKLMIHLKLSHLAITIQ